MDASLKHRIQAFAASDATWSFVTIQLRGLKDEGYDRATVEAVLNELRAETDEEEQEDRILEILDLVTGFCHPDLRIWES